MSAEAPPVTLASPLSELPGVGPRMAAGLRELGLRCLADALRHLPLRYEHERAEETIAAADASVGRAHGAEANVAVRGEVLAMRVAQGRRPRVEATLCDGTATMRLVWFNAPWLRRSLHPGMRIAVEGRARRHGDWLEMANPRWQPVDDGSPAPRREERLRPVYPASEALPSRTVESVIAKALPLALPLIEEHLPERFRTGRGLMPLAEAYRAIHAPADADEAAAARRRLAYDELLLLQLGVMMRRRQLRESMQAPALPWSDAIDRRIQARLPFVLTPDQRQAVQEIAADLARSAPMNRLLQGDVGAGKTVVAACAMLQAVAARRQAALMAPTELLAEQHHASLAALLKGADVRLALLTGQAAKAERSEILARLEAGELDIVVGTHALLTEHVRFRSLALAVIDEQHRFGVHQRAALRSRIAEGGEAFVPHVLVMTATPIPRTLSLTVFGDLDVTTIRRPPPGRSPVITRVVGPERADEVYRYVAERLRRGEQAYIVAPAIDDQTGEAGAEQPAAPATGLKNVASHLAWLERGPFAGLRLAAMHGRLPRSEREAVMGRFRAGEIDALVATVVIEVGVDVPNASLMVVEHAERFGLAQLHQLRGRVGRGARRSLCVLIGQPVSVEAQRRLAAIAETGDGFRIAERDLEIRGPGELFGTRQAGLAPFIAAELPRDFALLTLARRDAEEWIGRSPELAQPEEAVLRRRLMKAHGAALGLGDVG